MKFCVFLSPFCLVRTATDIYNNNFTIYITQFSSMARWLTIHKFARNTWKEHKICQSEVLAISLTHPPNRQPGCPLQVVGGGQLTFQSRDMWVLGAIGSNPYRILRGLPMGIPERSGVIEPLYFLSCAQVLNSVCCRSFTGLNSVVRT